VESPSTTSQAASLTARFSGWATSKERKNGLQEGLQEGRQAEAAAISLRLLGHRLGALTPSQQSRIQALPLSALEALLDALLDFQGPEDLNTWLSQHAA
jgi:hypothetical protein